MYRLVSSGLMLSRPLLHTQGAQCGNGHNLGLASLEHPEPWTLGMMSISMEIGANVSPVAPVRPTFSSNDLAGYTLLGELVEGVADGSGDCGPLRSVAGPPP